MSILGQLADLQMNLPKIRERALQERGERGEDEEILGYTVRVDLRWHTLRLAVYDVYADGMLIGFEREYTPTRLFENISETWHLNIAAMPDVLRDLEIQAKLEAPMTMGADPYAEEDSGLRSPDFESLEDMLKFYRVAQEKNVFKHQQEETNDTTT